MALVAGVPQRPLGKLRGASYVHASGGDDGGHK